MAPHMHDSHLSNMSQTTKSAPPVARIRPAIPLVFGRTKPSASGQELSQPAVKGYKADAITVKPAISSVPPPPETESSASPLPDAPLTPDSVPSTQAITGIVTPPDTLSDPNIESEESKASTTDTPASSYAPFSPSAVAMETPTMVTQQYPLPHHPPLHGQTMAAPQNFYMVQPVNERPAAHRGLTNGHHHRQRSGHHTSGGNAPRGSHGESMPQSYHPQPHNISISAGPIPHTSYNVAKYEQNLGYISPTAITSPTAWNPAANFFIPPSMPNANVPIPNGHGLSRSGSHSSSGPDIPPMIAPIAHPGHMYLPLPLDTVALGNYMTSQFSNREFADISLKIVQPGVDQFLPGFPVHAIIIARSPTLHALMRSQVMKSAQEPDGLKALTIEVTSKFIRRSSVLEAVGYLYGLPLHTIDDIPSGTHLRYSMNDSTAALDRALSLAGAGIFLKLPDVVNHALGFANTKLSWEGLDKTLSFVHESLEGLESLTTRVEQDVKHSLSLSVTNLFLQVERFLVEQFPKVFDFHASAPELSCSRRLPALQESRPSVSDPRLASIQFGAMPTEQSTHLELGNLLSSILLTVPTTLLQYLLNSHILGERIGWIKLGDIMREVVEERERRRLKIIKTRRVLPGATSQQWEETNWEEHLEASTEVPSGLILSRLRRETASPV